MTTPNDKRQGEALRRMSKPMTAPAWVKGTGKGWTKVTRPAPCPNCKERGGMREVYETGQAWCYTCGYRTGAGMTVKG